MDLMNDNNTDINTDYMDAQYFLEKYSDCISRAPPKPNMESDTSLLRELGALGFKIAVIIGIAAVLVNFVYGLHYNVEPGMNPSVKDGDLVMYYRWNKDYNADDLILVTFMGKKQVRRVVATAGDTVDITENGLMINGALQNEPGIYQETQRYAEGIEFPVILRESQVFVLGDARANTTDSRIYGPVNINATHGKVITIFRRRNL